jgi:hypothetical protein
MCSNGRATPCGCRRNQITTPHTQLQETEQWSFQNALDGCNVILELAADLRREIVRRGGGNVGISNIKPQCKHPNSSKELNLQSFYDIRLNQTTPAVMIYSDIYTRPIIAIFFFCGIPSLQYGDEVTGDHRKRKHLINIIQILHYKNYTTRKYNI